MNRAQRDLMDEVGLGTMLALAWSVGLLALLLFHSTPTMLIFAGMATAIALLFAIGVGCRWLYLGQREVPLLEPDPRRIRRR